jgi:preprotein translocase subunit Sec63
MRDEADPYAELGVSRDATPAEITHAFRQLLRQHHPDTRSVDGTTSAEDSALRLLRVIAAYAALSGDRGPAQGTPEPRTRSRTVPTRSGSTVPEMTDAIRAGPIRWSRTP